MSPFEFGQIVYVKAVLTRLKSSNKRRWFRLLVKPITQAIFLGTRTLSDGTVESTEGGFWFNPEVYHKGAWICRKGRNPEYALVKDLLIEV